jgi:hypothetical protein
MVLVIGGIWSGSRVIVPEPPRSSLTRALRPLQRGVWSRPLTHEVVRWIFLLIRPKISICYNERCSAPRKTCMKDLCHPIISDS